MTSSPHTVLATLVPWDGLMQTMFENYAESEFPESIKKLYLKLRQIEGAKTLTKVRKFLRLFTEEEINYLNSKFLDELYSIFITNKESLYFKFTSHLACEFLLDRGMNPVQNIMEAGLASNFSYIKIMLEVIHERALSSTMPDSVRVKLFRTVFLRNCPMELLDLLLRTSSVNVRNKCLLFSASICGDNYTNLFEIFLRYSVTERPVHYRSAVIYALVDAWFRKR